MAEKSGVWAEVLVVLAALGLWLLSMLAGLGGFALVIAAAVSADMPVGWRIAGGAVGVGSMLVALVNEFRQDPPHPGWWLGGAVLAVVAAFAAFVALQPA